MTQVGVDNVVSTHAGFPGKNVCLLAERATIAVLSEIAAPWTTQTQADPYGGTDLLIFPVDETRFSTFVIHWCGDWILGRTDQDAYEICCVRRTLGEVLAELRLCLGSEMLVEAANAA